MSRGHQRSVEEADLIERAKRCFPAGLLANLYLPEEYRFVPERAEGGRIYDKSGNEWIDYRCASGCLILGHRSPAVERAVTEQLAKGTNFTQLLNEPAIRLAEAVIAAVPSAEQVRFACTGEEAVFFAMRAARAFTGKDKILKFEGAYHGHGDHMVNMLPPGFRHSRIGHVGTAGIPRSSAADYVVVPFNDLDAVRAAVGRHAGELAGVIVEPILGYIPPRSGFLAGLRDITREHGVCLIFDEVVTGCRMAPGGAQEYYGVTPDLTALGKAFGGGFPISAVCGRREIMSCFDHAVRDPADLAYHGGTLYGHPVSAAASLAVMTELGKRETVERLYALGRTMREGLSDLVSKRGIRAQVMGEGPTWHLCFTDREVVDYRSSLAEDAALRTRFTHGLWANRIHVMGRGYLCLMHTEQDLAETLDACDRVMKTL